MKCEVQEWFIYERSFCLFELPSSTVSPVITATMLFLQFILYFSSFAGILKKWDSKSTIPVKN